DAIANLLIALQSYTLGRYPLQYARTQRELGLAHRWHSLQQHREEGQRENQEETIRCYHEALRVYTSEDFPSDYASIQTNLGATYAMPISGGNGLRENRDEAIRCYHEALRIYTSDDFPLLHTMTESALGEAYWMGSVGESQENLEEAIHYHRKGLQVNRFESSPGMHARLQSMLGRCYELRSKGLRSKNLEKAIHCYKEASRGYT